MLMRSDQYARSFEDIDWDNPPLWNPFFVIPRLSITDKGNRTRPLGELWPEQLRVIEAMIDHDLILILKARQIGITTIVTLFMLWYMLQSENGGGCIQITHESDAIASLNTKIRTAINGIPSAWCPGRTKDTAEEIGVGDVNFRQRMAGGRSQGRSFTYQHQHWTEQAYYPQGSAAVKGASVDRQVWASVRSTCDTRPGNKTVCESTANGPGGLFHELSTGAQRSEEWAFLFFAWFYDATRYTRPLPERWEMTGEELELLALYADQGLTEEHLAWRRYKMESEQYDRINFIREYPNNPLEPFQHSGTSYFSQDELKLLAARADQRQAKKEFVVWEKPKANRRYYVGADSSGGVGRDYATFWILRDDGKLVARFRHNRTPPLALARLIAKASALYGRAPVLVELNRHGKTVDNELQRLGVPVWRDRDTKKGWWTQLGANSSKVQLVNYAADLIAGGFFRPQSLEEDWLADSICIAELGAMVEDASGNISVPEFGGTEGDEGGESARHDDSAMGWMLALWCAKESLQRRSSVKLWTPDEARALRAKRLRDLGRSHGGNIG